MNEGKRKLILGCGGQQKDGWIGIDRKSQSKAHIIRDIEKGLPFDDSSVDEIRTAHLLEHIHALGFVMSEVWRVLKPGAIIHIEVPLVSHKDAYTDPTHVRFFTERSFKFFEVGCGWLQVSRDEVGDNKFTGGFEIVSQETQSNILKIDLKAVK